MSHVGDECYAGGEAVCADATSGLCGRGQRAARLYEWTDLSGGWDGRSNGHDVPDGAYYLNIQARGADGRKYNIKKVINLLRGYNENGTSTN